MKIHTRDDVTFTGTPEQVVGFLWKTAFLRNTSPPKYMRAVARRVKLASGKRPRTDTAAHFLADLAEAGVITILEVDDESTQ